MIEFVKRNLGIVAWVVFGLFISAAFWMLDSSRQETRRQICRSQLEAALTLRDLIDFSVAANPNPQAQAMVQKFYDRIELPPEICKQTNIDVTEFFKRPTTTTTSSTTTTVSTQPLSSPQTTRAPSTTSKPRTATTTTTPRSPPNTVVTTTTTTTPPSCLGKKVVGRCLLTMSKSSSWFGWKTYYRHLF